MSNKFSSAKPLIVEAVIEIPKGSSNKYEYNALNHKIYLDRVLYGANFYPGEYGFVPNTLDWDGDPLDVISLSTYPTVPGCVVPIRILGTIRMIDDGSVDTKLVGVIANDPRFDFIKTIQDFPEHHLKEITDFFKNYKNLQEKEVLINGIGELEEAHDVLIECQQLYQKHKSLILQGDKAALEAALKAS